MALSIDHPKVGHLAKELAKKREVLIAELDACRQRFADLPILNSRSAEEIIGYDDKGLPA